MRRAILSGCLVSLLALASPLRAAEEDPVEIDYVALAARLLRDNHYDRAEGALKQANTKGKDFDHQRYYTLLGVVYLKKKAFKPARQNFAKAIDAQMAADRAELAKAADEDEDSDEDEAKRRKRPQEVKPDPLLLLYLAQATYGMNDYRGVLKVLERARGALDDELSIHLMRSQSHWELKQPGRALAALRRGARAFPDHTEFTRLQIFYLIELELYQEAMEIGQRYLGRAEVTADDYVAVGEALRKGGQLEQAELILQGAHLRFPIDQQVMLALAHVFMDKEEPLAAGMVLEEASYFELRFAIEAAELYKRAGRLSRALSINSRVVDQKEKLKQRLAILLAMESFELVAAMAPSLSREGLLEDDSVRYALAYGFYKIGDFDAAERHLKHITQSDLFNNANQLRRAMESCRSSGWECI